MKLLYTLPIAFQLAQAADHPDTAGDGEFAMRLAMEEFAAVQGAPNQHEQPDPDLDAAIAMSLAEGMSGQSSSAPRQPESTDSDESIARLLAGLDALPNKTSTSTGDVFLADDVPIFHEISDALRRIYHQGCDVHAGDAYIPGQIPVLLGIATKILATCDGGINRIAAKPLAEIKGDLRAIVTMYSAELAGYKYEDAPKTVDNILQIIENQFNRSAGEVGNYASSQGTKVWAVTLALAMNLLNNPYVSNDKRLNVVNCLVDQSIEGMITQGGCIQGFVNRGFIALLNILAYYLPD